MEKMAVELALNGINLLVVEIHSFPASFLLLPTVSTYPVIAETKMNASKCLLINWLGNFLSKEYVNVFI